MVSPVPSIPFIFVHRSVHLSTIHAKRVATGMETGITWRPLGIRYRMNEVLFDIHETMDAIIDQRGMIISAEITGVVRERAPTDSTFDLAAVAAAFALRHSIRDKFIGFSFFRLIVS